MLNLLLIFKSGFANCRERFPSSSESVQLIPYRQLLDLQLATPLQRQPILLNNTLAKLRTVFFLKVLIQNPSAQMVG